jgi:hypothetical protein
MMPLHSPSLGAWANVQGHGIVHLQTSNQSPIARQRGTSAITPPSSEEEETLAEDVALVNLPYPPDR